MLVSGDDQGKIWVYDITKLPPKSDKKPPTQKATYVSIHKCDSLTSLKLYKVVKNMKFVH